MSLVGIYLGASSAVVAASVEGGPIDVVPNMMGHRITPLYVQCKGPGADILVGDAARSCHGTARDKGTVARNVGRWFGRTHAAIPSEEWALWWPNLTTRPSDATGRGVCWEVKGRDIDVTEVATEVLNVLLGDVGRTTGREPSCVYIAVPSYATPRHVSVMQNAVVNSAQLRHTTHSNVYVLPAPVATYLAMTNFFGVPTGPNTSHIVLHVGESTVDASLIGVDADQTPHVLAVCGDFTSGARELAAAAMKDVEEHARREGIDPNGFGPKARRTLLGEVERVCTELSVSNEVDVELDLGDVSTRYKLDVTTLTSLASGFLGNVQRAVAEALAYAPGGRVTAVHLSGGGSKCPLIASSVKAVLPHDIPVSCCGQPDEVCALGCALLAAQGTAAPATPSAQLVSSGIDGAASCYARVPSPSTAEWVLVPANTSAVIEFGGDASTSSAGYVQVELSLDGSDPTCTAAVPTTSASCCGVHAEVTHTGNGGVCVRLRESPSTAATVSTMCILAATR
eukprot:PhM_4_TR17439/c1_g1_i1/m.25391/K04043/dnaK, HSPA9; molecular chaperone DnaK